MLYPISEPGRRSTWTNYSVGDYEKCRYPPPKKRSTKKSKYIYQGISYGGFIVMMCLIAVVVAFIIVFAVKKHKAGGISSDSPEYALYKNTRFQECYNNASVSANTDCTAVENRLNNGRSSGFEENNVAYINTDTLYDGDNYDISWEWCEMISCFSDFKIVPSKPRPLAIWPTLLTTWGPVALYIVGSMFQFIRQQKGVYSKKKKACKGLKEISVLDWGVHAYDLASIVWWWYSFGRLVANPSHESTPIPVG